MDFLYTFVSIGLNFKFTVPEINRDVLDVLLQANLMVQTTSEPTAGLKFYLIYPYPDEVCSVWRHRTSTASRYLPTPLRSCPKFSFYCTTYMLRVLRNQSLHRGLKIPFERLHLAVSVLLHLQIRIKILTILIMARKKNIQNGNFL